jgi:hypothetical protein
MVGLKCDVAGFSYGGSRGAGSLLKHSALRRKNYIISDDLKIFIYRDVQDEQDNNMSENVHLSCPSCLSLLKLPFALKISTDR